MVPPGPGVNSLKVCFRPSWICCEVTHFKHGHSNNIDCSGIFRRTHKSYILYETQSFYCWAVWRDLKQRLNKTSNRRLLIYWENKVLAPVQRKLKIKHHEPLCEFHIISWNNDKTKPISYVHAPCMPHCPTYWLTSTWLCSMFSGR